MKTTEGGKLFEKNAVEAAIKIGILGTMVVATLRIIQPFIMPVLWAALVMILAIIQLPPILILGPIAAWVFTFAGTTPAVIFLVWALLVSGCDGFLKPILMGRGVDALRYYRPVCRRGRCGYYVYPVYGMGCG